MSLFRRRKHKDLHNVWPTPTVDEEAWVAKAHRMSQRRLDHNDLWKRPPPPPLDGMEYRSLRAHLQGSLSDADADTTYTVTIYEDSTFYVRRER